MTNNNGWSGYNTLAGRRQFLIELISELGEGKIRPAKFKPGGFDRYTSHLFLVAPDQEMNKLVNLQIKVIDKVKELPDNIFFKSKQWQKLEIYMKYLSREFKIHLQPRVDKIPEVISGLIKLILADNFLQKNIAGFKTVVFFPDEHLKNNRATIVIYLVYKAKRKDARLTCQQVLARLKTGLVDYEQYAEDRLPIYNFPISDLISFIQVGTDTKFSLETILGQTRFDKLFPKEALQALLMDEDPYFYIKLK